MIFLLLIALGWPFFVFSSFHFISPLPQYPLCLRGAHSMGNTASQGEHLARFVSNDTTIPGFLFLRCSYLILEYNSFYE